MGVAERRQREKEARIELIQKCAARLFAEKGFEGTSIESIAREAEIATGTIYLYFKSKEEIFYSLLFQITELKVEKLIQIIRDEEEPVDILLRRIAEHFHDSYQEDPKTYQLLWRYDASKFTDIMSEENHNRLHQIFGEHVREMGRLVERGIAQGIFDPVDTRVAGILIWNLFIGIFQYEQNRQYSRGGDHLKSTLEAAVDFILAGLKKT